MRICIISDIHANSDALKKVLDHANKREVTHYYFLGDLIDYGPDPVGVINAIAELKGTGNLLMVYGNHYGYYHQIEKIKMEKMYSHDKIMVLGKQYTFAELWKEVAASWNERQDRDFDLTMQKLHILTNIFMRERSYLVNNGHAIDSIIRNLLSIDTETRKFALEWYLEDGKRQAINYGPLTYDYGVTHAIHILLHGAFLNASGQYVYPWHDGFWLRPNFIDPLKAIKSSQYHRSCVMFGHSHIPFYLPLDDADNVEHIDPAFIRYAVPLPLGSWTTIINPGSVGQPRDLDPRTAYAILDVDANTITYYRLKYDLRRNVRRMRRYGYPDKLIQQLQNADFPEEMPDNFREVLHMRKAQEGSD